MLTTEAGLKPGAYITRLLRRDLAEMGRSMLRPYNGAEKVLRSEKKLRCGPAYTVKAASSRRTPKAGAAVGLAA